MYGHDRGGARADAPQRRRAGQHLPARHQPSPARMLAADDRDDADREQHPVAQDVAHDRQRHHAWRSCCRRCPGPRRRPAAGCSTLPPLEATTMPAISGPSISGRRRMQPQHQRRHRHGDGDQRRPRARSCRPTPFAAAALKRILCAQDDTAFSIDALRQSRHQCHPERRRRILEVFQVTNSSASPFMPRIVSISSTAAVASLASSVPRRTSETLGLPLRKAGYEPMSISS